MKNYLIVGASSGIGLATAKILKEEGNTLFTASRNESESLHQLQTAFTAFDATKDSFPADFLPETLHGVVYCPGSINLKPFHRFSIDEFKNDFEINLLGAVKTIQAALPALKKANGSSVVLFSTVASQLGMPFHASVASAKSAVEGLAKSLAAEYATNGIRVNVVAPSLTDTPLAEKLLSSPEKREASDKRHPLGRVGKPEDIAATVAFLLSEKAAWITGQILHVDGGMGALK
jgi:NAD(P)-dependent dehydrogenase (short-subunit alcohol dehydrogenase family)